MTMPSADRPAQEQEVTQAEQLVRYLSLYPQDLIDARWLMKRYCLSAADFQQALRLLEQPSTMPDRDTLHA